MFIYTSIRHRGGLPCHCLSAHQTWFHFINKSWKDIWFSPQGFLVPSHHKSMIAVLNLFIHAYVQIKCLLPKWKWIVQLNQPRLDIQSIGLVHRNATVLYSFHKDPSNKDLTLSWTWSSFKRGTTHPRSSNPPGTKTLKAMRKNVKDFHSKNNKSDQELSWCFSHGTDEDAYTRLSHRVEQRPWEPLQSVSLRVEQAE